MTIQAWSLKVRDFTVPPRQPSLGAIAPRDGCLGGTVKSLTFRLHGSIVPFLLVRGPARNDCRVAYAVMRGMLDVYGGLALAGMVVYTPGRIGDKHPTGRLAHTAYR